MKKKLKNEKIVLPICMSSCAKWRKINCFRLRSKRLQIIPLCAQTEEEKKNNNKKANFLNKVSLSSIYVTLLLFLFFLFCFCKETEQTVVLYFYFKEFCKVI